MNMHLRSRARWELALAGVSFGLFALTLVYPEWIEALSGFEPDARSGALEFAVAGALLLVALVSAALASRDRRRVALERR